MKDRHTSRETNLRLKPAPPLGDGPVQPGFQEILDFIQESRFRALRAVNKELVDLHWRIGEYLSHRVQADGWGQGTVEDLAAWILTREPGIRGFSASNLWRMRQFFETYRGDELLAPLVREVSWSHNTIIFNRCKSREERTFYLKLAVRERWGRRELERQMNAGLFEQTILGKPRLSAVMKTTHPQAEQIFKDRYLAEFVDLPEPHNEGDLQRALLQHRKHFLLELGRDFCCIASEYPIQVGRRDFASTRSSSTGASRPWWLSN